METRANHFIIGLFTIVVLLASISFIIWLNKKSNHADFIPVDVIFNEAVSGLNKGSLVEFNGIRVGEVQTLSLDKDNPQRVIARIVIDPNTPIKSDTEAKLISSAITGLSTIRLNSGKQANAHPFDMSSKETITIQAQPSALTKLISNGEGLLSVLNNITTQISALLSPENQQNISSILQNIQQMSEKLAQQDEQLSQLIVEATRTSQQAAESFQSATNLLASSQQLVQKQGTQTLEQAQQSLLVAEQSFATLQQVLTDNSTNLDRTLNGFTELGPTLIELRRTLASFRVISQQLEHNPSQYLFNSGAIKEVSYE